jgi:hypothetical protein
MEVSAPLSSLSQLPVIGILESTWDLGSSLMQARILRALMWFGLLNTAANQGRGRSSGICTGRRRYSIDS